MTQNREPIAIIGIGCRFPQADNPKQFWQLLANGVDAVTKVPASRREIAPLSDSDFPWGGFLTEVDRFDADFFGISPQEAKNIDPQQRLLLEVVWEALEDGGQVREKLVNSATGVFIGIASHDQYGLVVQDVQNLNSYSSLGTSAAIAANRISYFFDWRGVSMAVDTACSSSLVAIHLACQSLWTGESTLAIAGGANLILYPWSTLGLAQGGFMSPDGRCKTFDETANGYVRGEGAGTVLLKPLSQAQADKDPIYAIIRGGAVNQDGRSNGLTAPKPKAQEAVLRQAYRQAGISLDLVQYIEAHGTGTRLGDPMEMRALGNVLKEERSLNNRCAVGSVKTNIGHLEAAAGIAGTIKIALAFKNGKIPASLHFKQPNTHIAFDKLPLKVQQQLEPWSDRQLAIAGVSSFGFGGTNAHLVLSEAPVKRVKIEENQTERRYHVLTLSAKNKTALLDLASKYVQFLIDKLSISLADICHTANTGRSQFNYRLMAISGDRHQLLQQLTAFTNGKEIPGLASSVVTDRKPPKVAFIFPHEINLASSVGRELYHTQPTFKQHLDRCNAIICCYSKQSLLSILRLDRQCDRSYSFSDSLQRQLATFSLQYSLAQLWRSWGVYPTVVMGNGIGEYVAATIAEVFSLENAFRLIFSLNRERIEISPNINELTFSPAKTDIISAFDGELLNSRLTRIQYWQNKLETTEHFTAGIKTITQKGCHICLSMGTELKPEFNYLKAAAKNNLLVLDSLNSNKSDWQQMLDSLQQLYIKGVEIDWQGCDRDYQRQRLLQLPTYPFQRQRYWLKTSDNSLGNNLSVIYSNDD